MKKLVSIFTAIAILGSVFGVSTFAENQNSFGWEISENEGNAEVKNINSIKGNAEVLAAWGDSQVEFMAKKEAEDAYLVDFSMLMYDFNAIRTVTLSDVDILTIAKNGKISTPTETVADSRINQWIDISLYVYPSSDTYKLTVDDVTVSGEAAFSSLKDIKITYSQTDTKGAVTVISDPVISELPEIPAEAKKTEITTFIATQGGAPDYVRERIDDPTGDGRGTITHLKLNGKKWMEGRQNASFTGLSEVNVDWYLNDFGAEYNSVVARMNSTSGTWVEFVTFRHSDNKIVLGDRNSTDVIGSGYKLKEWYTIKLILDFDNSLYYVSVYDENMMVIASGSKAMDESFQSVAILSLYMGHSSLSGIARNSSIYVDNFYFKSLGQDKVTQISPFNNQKNVAVDSEILISASNIFGSFVGTDVTLNGKKVGFSAELTAPDKIRILPDDRLLPDTEYSLLISGLKSFSGTPIPVEITFKTADKKVFGELELDDQKGAAASIPVENGGDALVYAVIYDEMGKMLDYASSDTAENGVIKASVEGQGDNAGAYAWDSNMNIITPAVKTAHEIFGMSEPCDISVVKTDYDNDIVTVKGTANLGAAMILKSNKGDALAIREASALANGYFETKFKVDYSGEVVLLINTQDGQGIKTIDGIRLYTAAVVSGIIAEFNPDPEKEYIPDYKSLIEKYNSLFGFDSNDYSKVSFDDFNLLMTKSEGKYEDISDITDAYNYAVSVGLFNASENAADVKKLIDRYLAEHSLSDTKTYKYFEDSDDSVKNKVFENLSKRKDFKSMSDVKAEFEEQAVLAAIECATINSEIIPILEDNNGYLELDFSDFKKLNNSSAVTGAMRGKSYSSVSDMKEDFKTLTETALKNQNSSNKGSGGGGGGSSFGGGTTVPVKDVSLPQKEEVIEEVIKDTGDFQDIKTVPWAEECIIYLSDKNIINGKSKTHFMPLDNVTRAEFVKIISLAFLGNGMKNLKTPFTDVVPGAWYESFVSDAYERGFITGVDEDTFGVNNKITRQDIAVILYRVAKAENISIEKVKSVLFYDDAEISEYAKEAVNALAEAGIISGKSNNTFSPKSLATRAEAAKLVYCMLQLGE